MLENNEHWIAGAIEALAGGAICNAESRPPLPRQKIGRAESAASPILPLPSHLDSAGHSQPATRKRHASGNPIRKAGRTSLPSDTVPSEPHSVEPGQNRTPVCPRSTEPHSSGPGGKRSPTVGCPEEPQLAGPNNVDGQGPQASQTEIDGGHRGSAHLNNGAPVDTDPVIAQIVENWRRRMDLMRARMRLENQATSACRRICNGDKHEGQKLWGKIKGDPDHHLRTWFDPYLLAMQPLIAAQGELEKVLAKLVRKTAVAEWAKGVSGFGEVSLAGIIGESRVGPGNYRTVSSLWKRMGLAVIDGGRQRKVTGDQALMHGYNAERRALMWNIGNCLIKAQVRNHKDEDGKKIEGSDYALGELGQLYLERKAYLNERNATMETPLTKPHIHNEAKRYIEKRLLRQLWQAWRRAYGTPEPDQELPASEPLKQAA